MAKKPSKTETRGQQGARTKRLQRGSAGALTVPLRGRAPGTPNKVSAQAKDNILEVFLKLGGVPAMTKWARNNQTEFYSRIYARLIPKDVEVNASTGLEDLLTKLAEERSSTDPGHVVDGEYTVVSATDTVQ